MKKQKQIEDRQSIVDEFDTDYKNYLKRIAEEKRIDYKKHNKEQSKNVKQ